MDIFTLSFRDMGVKEGGKEDAKVLEKLKKQKVDKNFANWQSTYTIYMGIILQV